MRYIIRYTLVLTLLALPLALVSCGSSSSNNDGGLYGPSGGGSTETSSSTTAGGNEIVMKNIHFVPNEITVDAGTTVTWTNEDAVAHNVTSDDGLFESGNLTKGDTFTYTFDKPGTYNYHCTLHPPDMKGTVVVQ